MKTVKAIAFFACVFISASRLHAADPTWEWVQVAGGVDADFGTGVAVDSQGQIYFSGYMLAGGKIGSTTLSGSRLFWSSVSQSGAVNKVLSATAGSATQCASSLAVGPDDTLIVHGIFYQTVGLGSGYSVGTYNTGAFLANFGKALTPVWSKAYGVQTVVYSPPSISSSGDIFVSASFSSVIFDGFSVGSAGDTDALALRTRSDGTRLFLKAGGGTGSDYASGAAVDASGNAFIGGGFMSGLLAFGSTIATNLSGGYCAFLTKLDPTGVAQWSRSFGTNAHSAVFSIAPFSNGDVVIGGVLNTDGSAYNDPGTTTFRSLLARISSAGATLWSRNIVGLKVQDAKTAKDNNVIVLGIIAGNVQIDGRTFGSNGGTDVFVGKFDPDGNLIWGKSAGGIFRDGAGQLAVDASGSIFVAGTVGGAAQFDSLAVSGYGLSDAFLAKLVDPTQALVPRVTAQPVGTVSYFASSAQISVTVTSSVPVTYQWFRDGVAIVGQTSATLNIASVRPSDDANYYVEVTNQYGTVRSDSVHLIVQGDAPVVVTTIAGTNAPGFVDSTVASVVRFAGPDSPAIQGDGVIVIPDGGNNAIRLLEPNGTVGTLAGKGTAGLTNGPASVAYFNVPLAVALNSAWDIFVADASNNVVRKISATGTRAVTTYAGMGEKGFQDGAAAQAKFNFPNDLVCDPDGNLFVTEFEGNRVRKITTDGTVSTYAGTGQAGYRDGVAGQAMFNQPAGIARDGVGNLYVTEWVNQTIRKIGTNGMVSTIAGTVGQSGFVDGPALTTARLNIPNGICVDGSGNIFFTDWANSAVRRIDPLGDVLTLVGTAGVGFRDGGRTNAQMNYPAGIALHPDGSLIVADTGNYCMRRVVWQTNAAPTEAVVLIEVNPSITIFGVSGKTYQIESSESLVPPDWTVLGEVTLVAPVETWFDTQPVTRAKRFYRAVLKQ